MNVLLQIAILVALSLARLAHGSPSSLRLSEEIVPRRMAASNFTDYVYVYVSLISFQQCCKLATDRSEVHW